MSQCYKCDLTDEVITDLKDAACEWVVRSGQRVINGKTVTVSLIIRVDAFSGAQQTHLCANARKAVVADVKNIIAAITP